MDDTNRMPLEPEASHVHEHIEADSVARSTGRREFVALASAAAVATTLAAPRDAAALTPKVTYSATPPEGFSPFAAPGRVIKVSKAESLQANKLYPKPEDAKDMLTRALTELTGKATLVEAIKLFVHPKDKLVVKVNGIAQKNISTNAELVLPLIQAAIDAGVPADQITVLEQYHGFLNATRITANNVPKGVKLAVHSNKDSTMPDRKIPGTNGVSTKFATTLTDCTAVFNVALVKDHSICGYTGALKNMTHGTTMNPHDFHSNHASPQIAMLYAQDVIKSRVRLHIADAFKVMYHGGPLDKKPECRVPYEAVFASTDPVAMDTIGWGIVEEFRKKNGLKTLTAEGRAPAYIKAAAELGLGVHDREHIDLREVTI